MKIINNENNGFEGNEMREGIRKTVSVIGLLLFFIIVSFIVIVLVYIKTNISKNADIDEYYRATGESITEFYFYERNDEGSIVWINPVCLSQSNIYSSEKRLFAPYETIPEDLIKAFVAIEDKRFYDHKGVDWYRAFGAALNYVFKFRKSFGASTITQQLVKNVTGNDEYSIKRKIQEIYYARSLENQLTKEEILELYLNIINLSQGCRGIRTAAMTYFSKELSELDFGECVCLAAITQNPSYYDPYKNPENNKFRRQVIMDQMLKEGYIDENKYAEYYEKDVKLNMNISYSDEKVNSWYIDMVIDDVCRDLCEKYGYSYDEAESYVYTGGLKIYTLMDPEVQQIVSEYYEDQNNFPDANSAIKAQSSMIIVDPYTGDILAVAGGRGRKSANRIQNYATQTLRPSGSVVKPLSIFAPALEAGIITYASVYDDVPVNFAEDNNTEEMNAWPVNAPNVYHGLVNVNYAIEVSLNTVPIKILQELGKDKSFYFLKETLGMENLIDELVLENGAVLSDIDVAALALGQMNYGVTVREITTAYTMFANGGNVCTGRSYDKVLDSSGEIVLDNIREQNNAISRDNSIIMNYMLGNVVDHGTAVGITLDNEIPVCGKTGTTQDYHDRWFIGYTPYYLGGVWYGYEYPKSLDNNTKNICTKIWNDIMTEVHSVYKHDTKKFASSENIISVDYCADSGKLICGACLLDPRGIRIERGYFVKGTEPTEKCDRHVLIEYDEINGGVSLGNCPNEETAYVGLIQVERSFPIQVYVLDAQYVWKNLKGNIAPCFDKNKPFFYNIIPKNEYCGITLCEEQFNRGCKYHKNDH